MTDRLLYALVLPATAQTQDRDQRRRDIESAGTLGPGTPEVQPIAPESETRTLNAHLKGVGAHVTAQEFAELWNAPSIDVVPFTQTGSGITLEDGYYSLERAEKQRSTPSERRLQEFTGDLRKVGTKRSHWRALDTNATTESNPFGAKSTEEVGVSSQAKTARWFDRQDGSLEDASTVRTETGEHDDIDIFDATNPSIADPTLVYRIDYRHEWPTDCRVWDGRQQDQTTTVGATVSTSTSVGSTTVASEALQWQRVFLTDHDFVGEPILENDILRLRFDEANQRLYASRWNPGGNKYDGVSLGSSDWRLFDLNITRIGVERIDAQVEFEDTSSPGTTHNLNLSLKRGYTDGLWLNPDNEGSVPAGLVTRLDPIAHDSDQDPAAVAGLVERTEVDR